MVAAARTDQTDRSDWERTPLGFAIGAGAVAVIAAAFADEGRHLITEPGMGYRFNA